MPKVEEGPLALSRLYEARLGRSALLWQRWYSSRLRSFALHLQAGFLESLPVTNLKVAHGLSIALMLR